jgi:hypothetical protein
MQGACHEDGRIGETLTGVVTKTKTHIVQGIHPWNPSRSWSGERPSIIAVAQKGISMVRSLFAPVVDFSPTTFSEPFTKGCIGQSLSPLFLRSNPPQRRSLKDDYKASQIGKFSKYGGLRARQLNLLPR